MRFKIMNRSRQEGVLLLEGRWVTLQPGQTLLSDTQPQQVSANITVRNLAVPVERKNIVNPAGRQSAAQVVKVDRKIQKVEQPEPAGSDVKSEEVQ